MLRADRPDDSPRKQRLDHASAPAWKLDVLALAATGTELRGVAASRPGNALTVLYFGGNAFHLDQHGAEVLAAVEPCGVVLHGLLVPGAGHNNVLSNAVVQPAYCQFIGRLALR